MFNKILFFVIDFLTEFAEVFSKIGLFIISFILMGVVMLARLSPLIIVVGLIYLIFF